MFTNTRVFQYNNNSSQCIYAFDNFLDEDYKNTILNKTIELTETDSLNHATNVKANMTATTELLKHDEYFLLRGKIATFLNTCIVLRTPHWDEPRDIFFKSMWGMQHFKGNYTKKHTHGSIDWSGVYYVRSPDSTRISFVDVEYNEAIQENSLYIFPGSFQHFTSRHTSDISRVSIAFNIVIDWNKSPAFKND